MNNTFQKMDANTASSAAVTAYVEDLPGRRKESLVAAFGFAMCYKFGSPEMKILQAALGREIEIEMALWKEKLAGTPGCLSSFPSNDEGFFEAVHANIERLCTTDERFAELKRLKANILLID